MRPHGDRALPTLRVEPAVADGPFKDLGLSADTIGALAAQQITTPTPIQALTIPDALAGRDICGKARTGSGKTLAFGLPIVERIAKGRPGRPAALVLVPTRELASQVATAVQPIAALRGLRVRAIFGGVGLYPQAQALRAGVDIVVATPGRLIDLLQRGDVSLAEVAIAVIDEADQMADLGFLPQVRRIMDQVGSPRQVMLFSATLDGEVDALVRAYQREPAVHEAPTPVEDTPVMLHRFIGVDPTEKVAVTAAIASGPERTLLFVRTQRGADRLARLLEREGVAAGTIHGGLGQSRREAALRDFATGRVPVLVATNIAARGIHVDDVEIVVHHDPPEDAKTYLHRSGRTARAGASGVVVTLVEPEQARDVATLRRQAGLRETVVAMSPSDPRLSNLAGWQPALEEPAAARVPRTREPFAAAAPRGFRGDSRRRPAPARSWASREPEAAPVREPAAFDREAPRQRTWGASRPDRSATNNAPSPARAGYRA